MSLRSGRYWTVQARCVQVAPRALSSPAAFRKTRTGLPANGTIRPLLVGNVRGLDVEVDLRERRLGGERRNHVAEHRIKERKHRRPDAPAEQVRDPSPPGVVFDRLDVFQEALRGARLDDASASVLMQTHHGATLDYAVPSGVGEEKLFPGLRAYLRERFGAEAGEARIEPLAVRAGGIKEGGYGVPHRVSWEGASGPRTLVLETVRPGPFGHEDPSDRAGILLRAYEDYGTLPRHVRAVDVGAFRGSGPAAQPRRLRGSSSSSRSSPKGSPTPATSTGSRGEEASRSSTARGAGRSPTIWPRSIGSRSGIRAGTGGGCASSSAPASASRASPIRIRSRSGSSTPAFSARSRRSRSGGGTGCGIGPIAFGRSTATSTRGTSTSPRAWISGSSTAAAARSAIRRTTWPRSRSTICSSPCARRAASAVPSPSSFACSGTATRTNRGTRPCPR